MSVSALATTILKFAPLACKTQQGAYRLCPLLPRPQNRGKLASKLLIYLDIGARDR